MKKAVFRKIRAISEEVIGKEETDKIIEETINEEVSKLKNKLKIRPRKTKKEDK